MAYTDFKDQKNRGHYSVGLASGIVAAAQAANSELMQFRNSHASKKMVIKKISMSAAVSTTFFAAGVPLNFALKKSTAWSVAGTGGTAIAPAALLKRKLSMASSVMASGDIRVATTTALGAGTKTLETYPLKSLQAAGPITASLNGIILPETVLYEVKLNSVDDHALVLGVNEGLSLILVQEPATGTFEFACNIEWAELNEVG